MIGVERETNFNDCRNESVATARGWARCCLEKWRARARVRSVKAQCALRAKMRQVAGQGTTEYAILVGVLVVLAIVAITLFRPKLEELWTAIADGINGL